MINESVMIKDRENVEPRAKSILKVYGDPPVLSGEEYRYENVQVQGVRLSKRRRKKEEKELKKKVRMHRVHVL